TVYAATEGGGVFKSTDGALTWSAASSGLDTTTVRGLDLVVDPPSLTTVLAATFGGGVFRSIDEGGQWTAVNPGLTNPFVLAVVDPMGPAPIWPGTDGGGAFRLDVVPCTADADCDDANPCTLDVCDPTDPTADVQGCLNPVGNAGAVCRAAAGVCDVA